MFQVDYDFRLFQVSAVDPANSRHIMRAEILEYLKDGWEVKTTNVVQVSGNDVFVAVSLVKYSETPLSVAV